MTVKDDILKRLLAGEDYSKIYRSVKGKKPFYEAYNEWLDIKEKQYVDLKAREEKLTSRVNDLQDEETILIQQVSEGEEQVKKLANIEKQIVDAKFLLDETQKKFSDVQEQLSLLKEKGFTIEILQQILRIDVNGAEYLKRLESGKAYNNLLQELHQERKNLKKVLQDKENTKKTLMLRRKQLETIDSKIGSQGNKLDELQKKTRGYKDGVHVVRGFFSQGYTVDDLTELRRGLDLLHIQGDPAKSLSRVFEAIKKEGLLSGLTDRIVSSRKELKTLKENVGATKAELKALIASAKVEAKGIPAIINVAIEEVKAKAINELEEVTVKTKKTLVTVSDQSLIKLGTTQKLVNTLASEFKKGIEKALSTLESEIRKTMKSTDVEAQKNMAKAVTQLNSVTGKYDKWFNTKIGEFKKYLEMREWMAENSPKIKEISAILSVMEDPSAIMQMNIGLIMSLSKGIEVYVKENCYGILIEETAAMVKSRQNKTSLIHRTLTDFKQSYSFPLVIRWSMNELRRNL